MSIYRDMSACIGDHINVNDKLAIVRELSLHGYRAAEINSINLLRIINLVKVRRVMRARDRARRDHRQSSHHQAALSNIVHAELRREVAHLMRRRFTVHEIAYAAVARALEEFTQERIAA